MKNFTQNNTSSKYHRREPIKEFDLCQTMYSLILNESKNSMSLKATGFIGNSMTYGELIASSERFAQALYEAGVRETDNVSILTVSMPIVQQCILALSKIGATMSWIDLRTKAKDLIKYINDSRCKYLVAFDQILPLIKSIIDKSEVKKVIICSAKDYFPIIVKELAILKENVEGKRIVLPKDDRFVTFSEFVKNVKGDITPPVAKFDKNRPSIIVQSSGSTGKPKQIVHTEYNFNSAVQKMAYTDLPFYKGSTMHISIPPFIIYGLGNSIYGCMAFTMKAEMNPFVGDYTVYNDLGKFDISLAAPLHYRYIFNKLIDLNKTIANLERDTSFSGIKAVKQKQKERQRVLSGIERAKVFVSGGDKLDAEEMIEMQQLFGKLIVNGYGNNECLGATIVSPMYANRPGSIGVPMHGTSIKVVDPETGESVPDGSVGELYISADNLFMEYLNNSEETRKIKVGDDTGKIG